MEVKVIQQNKTIFYEVDPKGFLRFHTQEAPAPGIFNEPFIIIHRGYVLKSRKN